MITVHGGLDEAELRSLGLRPEEMLDFSANINPLGPSDRVRQAAVEAELSAYPDRTSLPLREALAARLDVGIDSLIVGNGSTELIHLLARACLNPGERCLIFAPTFGEYEAAAMIAGAEVHLFRAEKRQGFRWQVDAAVQVIEEIQPDMVFLCNPNNPTGVYLGRDEVWQLLRAMDGKGLLALDDAYVPLADWQWDSLSLLGSGNVAILRSMTKDHALAGVRLGYMVAESKIVSAVRQLQPAWSVNAVAQAVGVAALEDEAHVEAARDVISKAKRYLYRELGMLGIPTVTSAANFVLAEVGEATEVRSALLRQGIVVRDCASFGLPEYIRVAARLPEECAQLVASLREVLGHE